MSKISIFDALEQNILTYNGCLTNGTAGGTYAKNVDMFGLIGGKLSGLMGSKVKGLRSLDPENDIEKEALALMVEAFQEDALLGTKNFFRTRNCRRYGGGIGIKRVTPLFVKWMTDNDHIDIVVKNLSNYVRFGYWKDIVNMYRIDTLKPYVVQFITQVIASPEVAYKTYPGFVDMSDVGIQRLMKFLPRQNMGSGKNKGGDKGVPGLALDLVKALSMSYPELDPQKNGGKSFDKLWRKFLADVDRSGWIVERDMCANKWNQIAAHGFQKIPSKALQRYGNAWVRHLNPELELFNAKVEKGEVKGPNANGLWPFEFKLLFKQHKGTPMYDTLVHQWNQMPQHLRTNGVRALNVIDGSGSMTSWGYYSAQKQDRSACDALAKKGIAPIDVAAFTAMFAAEQVEEPWRNQICTFSNRPQFFKVDGDPMNRFKQIRQHTEIANTNIIAVHQLIIERGLKHSLRDDQMINLMVIYSDMEFDSAGGREYKSAHDKAKELYRRAGYTMPVVVYWNINSYDKNLPVKADEKGTVLCSGPNPSVLEFLSTAQLVSPEALMLEVLNNEVYDSVVV